MQLLGTNMPAGTDSDILWLRKTTLVNRADEVSSHIFAVVEDKKTKEQFGEWRVIDDSGNERSYILEKDGFTIEDFQTRVVDKTLADYIDDGYRITDDEEGDAMDMKPSIYLIRMDVDVG